jgi:thiamine pyrophosphate-dependent acetolactate synthase large subunit-like protein
MMRVYEALARELQRCGVEVVFGLCGSETVKLCATLESIGVRFVGARHESQAVMMADGYARVTGRVGVTLANRGPGFTNALTSMICAAKAGSPVLVISGDTAIGVRDQRTAAVQRVDPKHVAQDDVTRAAGIVSALITSPEAAVADLRATLDCAQRGTTIAVHVPTDVLEAPAGDAGPVVRLPDVDQVPEPDEASIAEIAEVFESGWAARRPVILAGRGAYRSGARAELERLGELTGAVLATSLMNRSFFAGNPYDIGVCGSLATPVASELLVQADLVLAFGASLNKFTTYDETLFAKARIVQIDTDPAAFGRHTKAPDLTVQADATLVARTLITELEKRGYQSTGQRTAEVASSIRGHRAADHVRDDSTDTALDPRALMIRLDELLPAQRTLVVEAGDHLRFSSKYLSVPPPPAFVFPMETFAIGLGIGAAIGAAVGDPSRLTVLEIGDGGLMMTLGDLETAVRCRVPMVVVISNNGGLGSEMKALAAAGLPTEYAMFPVQSFAAIATAMGAEAYSVATKADLELVGARLQEPIDGPVVLDCHVLLKLDAE